MPATIGVATGEEMSPACKLYDRQSLLEVPDSSAPMLGPPIQSEKTPEPGALFHSMSEMTSDTTVQLTKCSQSHPNLRRDLLHLFE